MEFKRLHAAFVAMPGHKALFGPQGTGLLLCGERGEPLMHGGSGSNSVDPRMPDFLPDRLEAGTHNVCGIAGLLEGIRYVRRKGTASILAHEKSLLRTAVRELEGTDGIELFTGEDDSQCGDLRPCGAALCPLCPQKRWNAPHRDAAHELFSLPHRSTGRRRLRGHKRNILKNSVKFDCVFLPCVL